MCDNIDVLEDEIEKISPQLLQILLKDNSTSRHYGRDVNIIWATNDYESMGDGYHFTDEIKPELITGCNGLVIRPRARKSDEEQQRRITDKAEVFTPTWICNKQNNLVDEAWFGRPDIFNTEKDNGGIHTWTTSSEKISFPETKGHSWQDYVCAPRMEMACGEAPYITSRYDATQCNKLIHVKNRVGFLDRKLRIVGENTTAPDEWLIWAFNALHATYGFEWQGDNLLLAREAVLYTFIEHFEAKFSTQLDARTLENAAFIISWNIWQMDGIKCVVPMSCDWAAPEDPITDCDEGGNLVTVMHKRICPACHKKNQIGHIGIKCIVAKWRNVTSKEPGRVRYIRDYYRYPNLQIPIKMNYGEKSF